MSSATVGSLAEWIFVRTTGALQIDTHGAVLRSFEVRPRGTRARLKETDYEPIPGIGDIPPLCGMVRPGIAEGVASNITPSASNKIAVP